MATRIRLQRHGKKGQPFYHVVIADGRAPRDGRFIEKLGTYNPMHHPAEININFERALHWVMVGASPSDTVRSILKHEGVYLMKHLKGGIQKGAITESQAEQKFEAWKQEKEAITNNLKKEAAETKRSIAKKRLEEETKVKEAISEKVAQKLAAQAKADAAANVEEAAAEEEVSVEAQVEETLAVEAVEETVETVEEAPVAEQAEETPAEEAQAPAETAQEATEEPAAE